MEDPVDSRVWGRRSNPGGASERYAGRHAGAALTLSPRGRGIAILRSQGFDRPRELGTLSRMPNRNLLLSIYLRHVLRTGSQLLVASAIILLVVQSTAFASAAQCLDDAGIARVARVVGPDGQPVYARVIEARDGVPIAVAPIASTDTPLADVFEAVATPIGLDATVWRIGEDEVRERVCAPVSVPQEALYDETSVIISVGLNYAAHADEAGGGDVFLFPKPVEPSAPYGHVAPPDGVVLLDYEVELAYVLLEGVDLSNRPDLDSFLDNTAFFVSNDITDREALIKRVGFSPPGIGFVEGKGQPNFLPAGPWMVRGRELFAAAERCGQKGLRIGLSVDEGDGFVERQNATTEAMIVKPHDLLAQIANQIESEGLRTTMPFESRGGDQRFPFAIQRSDDAPAMLPAGTIIQTGTPEGVAMQAPSIPGVTFRGLLRLRGPLEQFRIEQIARAKTGEPGGYLAPGDRVRAWIDGLGAQEFDIHPAGSKIQHDPCD